MAIVASSIRDCVLHGTGGGDFGQHKIEGTLIGATLLGLSIAAVVQGWLMPWGLLLWIPVFLLGLSFLCLVGHFLFLFPVVAVWDCVKTLRDRMVDSMSRRTK